MEATHVHVCYSSNLRRGLIRCRNVPPLSLICLRSRWAQPKHSDTDYLSQAYRVLSQRIAVGMFLKALDNNDIIRGNRFSITTSYWSGKSCLVDIAF